MDLRYITGENEKVTQKICDLGYDLEAIFLICKDLLNVGGDLILEEGDLRDFIYRLRNRFDHLNGLPPDLKLRCEDASPFRISYQPSGQKSMFYFSRSPGQDDHSYKEATYYCEICGPATKFKKKDVKVHISNSHKT